MSSYCCFNNRLKMKEFGTCIRHRHRLAYEKVRGDGFAGSDGHLEALAHPPGDCPNKRDWAHKCEHFTTNEFKVYIFAYCLQKFERGRLAAAAKQINSINHSNGNKNFTSIEYELMQATEPCDPVTFFRRTHNPEKKINTKCKEMSIFHKVRNAGCSGKRRRKAHPTNYILYQKKEEEMAELTVRMASLGQENKRLKKETGPNATKKWLNEYLVKNGMTAMALSSESDAEDDDEDADMHGSQIHEHRDAFEGSDGMLKRRM
ncbi:hypothetical protein MKX03_024371 [Papaver bracteatum]|nr:hypothetical protein MKX03_024371 [Papaver bracteatum]